MVMDSVMVMRFLLPVIPIVWIVILMASVMEMRSTYIKQTQQKATRITMEQKKRGIYQGTEYSAISIEYLSEGSGYTKVLSTIVITKDNSSIEVLFRAALKLMHAHTLEEKLSETENRIATMMYGGALNIAPFALASAAQALRLHEEELKNHFEHLNELGLIDLANERLMKKVLNMRLPSGRRAFLVVRFPVE